MHEIREYQSMEIKIFETVQCVSSHFLNEKVLMILTCIILKVKAQLK